MKRSAAGYTILEMTAAISLMAVFLFISAKLISQVAAVQRDATAMEWSVSRMEFALRELRRDVWNASAMNVLPAGGLGITASDGSETQWVFEPNPSDRMPERGWMVRQTVSEQPDPTPPPRFEVPAAIEFTRVGSNGLAAAVGDRQLWLASQVMLAADSPEGGRP